VKALSQRFSAKHVWHGILFLVGGVYALGVHCVFSEEGNILLAGTWGPGIALGIIVFGLFLLIRGQGVIDRPSVVIEYYDAIVLAVGIALLVRSFILEPFKIPSGSMIPTLLVGDYLFVQKYAYGYRIPYVNGRLAMGEGPKRGDVAVFKYPKDPGKDYIKRIIGLPGDTIRYENKRVSINGVAVSYQVEKDEEPYLFQTHQGREIRASRQEEQLEGHPHDILLMPPPPPSLGIFPGLSPLEITVPPGHYFVLGDNRDNSNDSRFWGFVPTYLLVGRAVMLFWSWDQLQHEVRWDRLLQRIQ
jgi:signal peptidase I